MSYRKIENQIVFLLKRVVEFNSWSSSSENNINCVSIADDGESINFGAVDQDNNPIYIILKRLSNAWYVSLFTEDVNSTYVPDAFVAYHGKIFPSGEYEVDESWIISCANNLHEFLFKYDQYLRLKGLLPLFNLPRP